MQLIHASIITIGDELLIGQVVDTNSAWMAQELNRSGIWVKRKISVGDNRQDIWDALDEESRHVDIILITGGLGPTADDITKPLLSEYFGGRLVVNEQVKQHVIHLFEKVFRRPITERNLKQAEVPDVSTVLHNARGTAPGMWFEKQGKIFVSMPGVPHEMKGLMSSEVIPRLQQRFSMPFIRHRTLLTAGIGESYLADTIRDWEEKLPAHMKLAYLPNLGMVRLRLTASGGDEKELDQELDDQFSTLRGLVAQWIAADTDIPLSKAVGELLKKKSKTMGTAESCTGGYIAALITSQPGSSEYFKGSIVSYANEVKEKLLHVPDNILATQGAVSEATVKQMVAGALDMLGVDYALATSGIMGPTGGTDQKPVGTIWVATGNRDKIVTQLFNLRFDRQRNTEQTANNALNMLRKFIEENG